MNKKKVVLIVCLVIGIFSILAGTFAFYRIVVSGNIKLNTGNAVFVLRDSDESVWENKVINLNGGNAVNPGDSGSFTVKMDVSGSNVDIYATLEIGRSNIPTNLKFYTTSDKKSELHKYYSFLEPTSPSETLTIYWYWNPNSDDTEDNKFINKSNLSATIKVNAVQISEYAIMKNGYSEKTEFWSDTYKKYIRTIKFGNDLSNLPSSCTEENLCWNISESSTQNKKVYGYLMDSGSKDSDDNTKSLYNLYIVSEAPIFAPSDCSYMFSGFKNLININFNNNFNTSKVTDMSNMFSESFYENIPSSGEVAKNGTESPSATLMFNDEINMLSVETMQNSSISLDLSGFNSSNVTNMSHMFYVKSNTLSSLTTLDLSNFDTSNVSYMSRMFYGCSSLTELDLSSFNTSNVTEMGQMFCGCSSLITEINIMNIRLDVYTQIFSDASTESGAQITVNYITGVSTFLDSMIATKSSNSNVVKGSVIPEYTITISGNDDITYKSSNTSLGTIITLSSISGNNYVTSFKMNGTLVEGNKFTMPSSNTTITDITTTNCITFETAHYPYARSQDNVIIGEKTFEGAKSLTVILDYQTDSTGYDYFYIYDFAISTTGINDNKKYCGRIRTKETITINGNYIKITFTSNSYANHHYGLKAIIIPNY